MKNTLNADQNQNIPDQIGMMRLARMAPRPKNLDDTGLSRELVVDLIAKHLLDKGTISLAELSAAMCLPGALLETQLNFMRTEAMIEISPNRSNQPGLNYNLTDRLRQKLGWCVSDPLRHT